MGETTKTVPLRRVSPERRAAAQDAIRARRASGNVAAEMGLALVDDLLSDLADAEAERDRLQRDEAALEWLTKTLRDAAVALGLDPATTSAEGLTRACRRHEMERTEVARQLAAACKERDRLREALAACAEVLASGRFAPDGHDGDEESGEHDEDCARCEWDALGARVEEALTAAGRGKVSDG
jgi:hypothetical protein